MKKLNPHSPSRRALAKAGDPPSVYDIETLQIINT